MRIYLLALLAIFAFQSANATDPHPGFKIKGHAKVAVDGAGTMQEKPDVTLDWAIGEADRQIKEAMRQATEGRNNGSIKDAEWSHVKGFLKSAAVRSDQARESMENDPATSLAHLKAVDELITKANLWNDAEPASSTMSLPSDWTGAESGGTGTKAYEE